MIFWELKEENAPDDDEARAADMDMMGAVDGTDLAPKLRTTACAARGRIITTIDDVFVHGG